MQPGSFRVTPCTPYDVVIVGANQAPLVLLGDAPCALGPSKAAIRQATQYLPFRSGRREKMSLYVATGEFYLEWVSFVYQFEITLILYSTLFRISCVTL